MTNILSRFMTEAHADSVVVVFCFLLLRIWLPGVSYPAWVTPRLRQSCSCSVTEKGHVVLETDTYALWSAVALRIGWPDSRVS
jgi:hypothetical protein